MEKFYREYQTNLGGKVNTLPIVDDHIDFQKSHTQCRDLPCAITFVVFLGLGFTILIYSVAAGRPGLLYKPVDDSGGVCGFNFNGVDNRKKKFWSMDASECISSCPSSTKSTMSYCVDETSVNALETLQSDVVGDIVSRIWVAAIALAITAGLCFLYIFLLIFFAQNIVWGSIFVAIGGIGILALSFFILSIVMFARRKVSTGVVCIIFAVAFLVVFIVVTIVVYYLRFRIRLCIALIQEACRGIKALPGLIFVPIASTVVIGFVYFLFCLTLIFFIGGFKIAVFSLGGGFGIRIIECNGFHIFVILLDIFIVLWASFLCIGLAQSTVAGGLAAWYFARDRNSLAHPWPVFGALYRTFRYSLGTVCAGSGIIALTEVIKLLFYYDKNKSGGGGCFKCLCCCVWCVLDYLQRYLVFISARAYIIASITGNGFIQTCKDAFYLLLRNILITIVLESVKTVPLTLGKIFIFIITAFFVLIICNPFAFSGSGSTGGYVVTYWFFVYMICVVIILFVIQTMTAIVVYGVDSIFIFFLYDEEFAQTTGRSPYASLDLTKHMDLVTDKGREMAQKNELSIVASGDVYAQSQSSSHSSPPLSGGNVLYSSPSLTQQPVTTANHAPPTLLPPPTLLRPPQPNTRVYPPPPTFPSSSSSFQ